MDGYFKDTLKAFDDFKNKQQKCMSISIYIVKVKVYIFWKLIQDTIQWDKIQMLEKLPSEKINVTKNPLFLPSQAPIHHDFTFNSQLIYELKSMVHLSKVVCGIFHFRFRLIFFSKKHGLFDFKMSNFWVRHFFSIRHSFNK